MAYQKNYPGGWQDLPSEETPITAATLDHIEDGIVDAAADADAALDAATGAVQPSDLATVATSGAYDDLSGQPSIPSTPGDIGAQPAGDYLVEGDLDDYATTAALNSGLSGKANTTDLFSGAYDDLTGKPVIPSTPGDIGAQPAGDYATTADLADKADRGELFSGDYGDLTGKPSIPSVPGDIGAATAAQGAAADTAVQPGELADVATSGAYSDLSGQPTIPSTAADVGARADDWRPTVEDIDATGTPSSTTYLRGDGAWGTPSGGGGGGPVTSEDITDATAVGKAVLTAADAATARSEIGAGTSDLEIGTTASTAMAGNTSIPSTPGDIGAATAAQGSLADTAVQPADLDPYALSSEIPSTPGDIGAQPAGSYATGAQGALADTAVQPAAIADMVTSATVTAIVSLTQAAYDGLTPDPATLYVITG